MACGCWDCQKAVCDGQQDFGCGLVLKRKAWHGCWVCVLEGGRFSCKCMRTFYMYGCLVLGRCWKKCIGTGCFKGIGTESVFCGGAENVGM